MKEILFIAFFFLLSFGAKAQNDTVGIFLRNGNEMQAIVPIKMIQTKANTLATALTMGVASTSMKTVYSGTSSKNIANKDSKFNFYFMPNVPLSMIQTYFMFSASCSPSDFIVAKMNSKKKTRELSIGKVNIYAGVTMGTNEDTSIELNVKKLREGSYEMSFAKEPEPGEYCFIFLSPNGSGAFLPIFDFKIE